MRGAGRATFAAILLLIVGVLNVVYGIGALSSANIFVNDKRFILDNLNTMGWVLIIIGALQLTGGFSLFAGNTYGRVIGIIAGSLGAISALFSIGGTRPVVVAGRLLPVRLDRLRHRRPRSGRTRATEPERHERAEDMSDGGRRAPRQLKPRESARIASASCGR